MPMPSKPGNTPASLPFQPSSSPAAVSRRFAWVRCLSHTKHHDADQWPQWPTWLSACYQLTPYLQRFGVHSALLDLGLCTDAEAVAVVQSLITHLGQQQITLRAAIAPGGILAQLALIQLLRTPGNQHELLALITPEQSADMLRQLPITALTRLQFADPTPSTSRTLSQAVSWLEDYGIRTLAQLTRLDDDFLRRQFGARLGALLAAIARGEDIQPLQPTPAPLCLRFRLRLTSPVTPDRLLLGLAPFCCEVASKLARRGLHGHTLELRLRWEGGSRANSEGNGERVTTITRTLPQPLSGGRALAETLERMLAPLFQSRAHAHHAHEAIEDLHLSIPHLTPRYPAQHAFWPQRARRLAATHELADVLARRHGKPLLLRSALTAPDAIFDQNRSHLMPLHANAADIADVAEGLGHPARPAADVADVATDTGDTDTGADSAQFPHGIHWW